MTPSNLSNRFFTSHRSVLYCIYFCIGMLVHPSCKATILATGDSSTPYTFSVPVSAKTYDPYTGTLYVGLSAVPATAAYLISSVSRPFGNATPTFTQLGAGITISAAINYLALLTYPGNLSPLIAFTQPGTYAVSAITNNGSVFNTSAALYDANDTPALIGGDIVALTANRYYAFAAVPPATGTFGAANSGVAVVCVKATTSNGTTSAITLTQTRQTIPDGTDPQVRAKKVDNTTDQVITNSQALSAMSNSAKLYWDEPLQRLYIGIQGTSAAVDDAGIKSVVVGSLDNTATLTLINIIPDNTIDKNNDTNMVAAATIGTTQKLLAIMNLGVMHCSTGPSYLIINGGNGTNIQTSNKIYALPLIDNPTSQYHGTVANINAGYVNHVFTLPPVNNNDLPQSSDAATTVGAGPLPIAEDSLTVSDMVVIGDTVYVAITGLQSATHENGVLYSQALFAADGSIAQWTAWTKRAFPYRGFCDNTTCINTACTTPYGCNTGCQTGCTSLSVCDIGCQNEGVFLFAVDAVNGKVWAVDGTSQRIVRLTAWDRGGCISQLPCKVSQALPDGCYSALDLDQYTKGFSAGTVPPGTPPSTTKHRYALFGGCNKVVFTRVSEAIPTANVINLRSPQNVITDYSLSPTNCTACTTNPQNILVTTLPKNAGCVNQLEYSRQTTEQDAQNYFFSGTDTGLYVFADAAGNGFNVTALTTLDKAPFTTDLWHTIGKPFNVPIVAIKTTGNFLYIITCTIEERHSKYRLYKITFTTNLNTMFANQVPIAETGIAPFANILGFTGIQPVYNGADEQLFLTTNKGLFLSNNISAGTPTWQLVPADVTSMFAGIAGVDTLQPLTVWPFSVQDPSGYKIFDRSSIFQISGPTTTPATLTFVPDDFNANSCNNAFNSLYPITYFWSDGARRFFIINRSCEDLNRNRLMVLPYDVNLWHVTNPAQQIITYDSFVIGAKRFFWVKQIGIIGIFMAGTDRGVIALE